MSNQMIEALQGIMNQANGETLDVPHPADIKHVDVKTLTGWHESVLKEDRERLDDGDWKTDVVTARLVEVTQLDEYKEPLGEPKLMLQHKYGTAQRQSKDISVTAVKPDVIRKLKARFPGAFAEYEMKLLRERGEPPLVLLDDVPPDVIQALNTLGVRTIRQFAEYDEAKTTALVEKLRAHKMDARANYVRDYLTRARERVGFIAPEPEAPTKRKQQAA